MTKMEGDATTMNCGLFQRELERTNAASPLLGDDSRAHAARCPSCAVHLRKRITFNHLLRSLDPITPPPDFDARLQARLDARNRTKRFAVGNVSRFKLPSFTARTSFVKVIACCLSLVFLTVIFHASSFISLQQQKGEETPSLHAETLSLALTTNPASNPVIKDETLSHVKPTNLTMQARSPFAGSSVNVNFAEQRRAVSKRRAKAIAPTEIDRSQQAREAVYLRNATINVSPRMMEATLRDGRRAGQAVMLNAVSFGDDTLSRNVKLATATSQQGVW